MGGGGRNSAVVARVLLSASLWQTHADRHGCHRIMLPRNLREMIRDPEGIFIEAILWRSDIVERKAFELFLLLD